MMMTMPMMMMMTCLMTMMRRKVFGTGRARTDRSLCQRRAGLSWEEGWDVH